MQEELKDVLGRYVEQSTLSAGQLQQLSGVSRRTILNWLEGRSRKPHKWYGLAKVAQAMNLNEVETDEILQSAHHPTIKELRQETSDLADLDLLGFWADNSTAPFEVIADLPYFAGRETAIEALSDLLQQGEQVTICSLRGMGGVGKTSLAAHLAYLLRPIFPDGVLWARLDTSDSMSILHSFAGAYGEDVSNYRDLEGRSAAVRRILAEKRALLILDNAESSAQVRPLLPPTTGNTAVIVTTRHELAVSDDMHRFEIEPFSKEDGEAIRVFTHFLGQRTVTRFYDQLQTIADLLGHLPLAIAIAAGRLSSHPSIPDYLRELQLANKRLDPLNREDRNVRLSFDISFKTFSSELQRFFITLGTFGGEDFSLEAAAFVGQLTEAEADKAIQSLVQQSFVQIRHHGRFALHPLIREYAIEKIEQIETWQRMITYYTSYAQTNQDIISLISQEKENITFALDSAEEHELPHLFVEGVIGISQSWRIQGDAQKGTSYEKEALKIAQLNQNRSQEAFLLAELGANSFHLGQFEDAIQYEENALAITSTIDDKKLSCRLLNNLGVIYANFRNDYLKAIACWEEALTYALQLENNYIISHLYLSLGNGAYELNDWQAAENYWQEALSFLEDPNELETFARIYLLNNLGTLANVQGGNEAARHYIEEARTISIRINQRENVSTANTRLGKIALEENDLDEARKNLDEAAKIAREIASPDALCFALMYLGKLHTIEGDFATAVSNFEEALQIAQDAQILWQEVSILIYYADLYLVQHQPEAAEPLLTKALTLCEKTESLELTGWVHFGLARMYTQLGEPLKGVQFAQSSYAALEKLGAKKAEEVKIWLSEHES